MQAGNKAFSLAAENGCVDMLRLLMDDYDMATMKPNKVGVDSGYLNPHSVSDAEPPRSFTCKKRSKSKPL